MKISEYIEQIFSTLRLMWNKEHNRLGC